MYYRLIVDIRIILYYYRVIKMYLKIGGKYMRKTNMGNKELGRKDNIHRMSVSTEELQLMLGCGRKTAVYIGTEAGARLDVGKRVLWVVDKVQEYISAKSL